MIKKKLISLLMFLVIFLLGCTQNIETFYHDSSSIIKKGDGSETTGLPTTLIEIDLRLSKAPLLGETVLLNTTVTTIQADVINASFNINLPTGFELISTDLPWEGNIIILNKTFPPFNESNLQARISISFISYIKAIQEGNWTITGVLSDDGSTTDEFKQYGRLYISVSGTNSYVRDSPFPKSVEPCIDKIIDGELVQCTTAEPTGDFIETNN